MTKNHKLYLDIAYQLAEKNLGKTGLNPSVGSIVVKDGVIISSGITSYNGRPHAEFNALNKLKNCSGAELYTTLEPCVHYGKTPPCVNIIIKKKIKNVYFGCFDPDVRSFRKAKTILKKNGIIAKKIKSKKYKNFYNSYFINRKLNIPYISAKIALSDDFFYINKKRKWITSELSRKIAHLIRSRYDCILSTSKTINLDNSLLNCRIDGLNRFKPDLFILDLNLKLKKNLHLNKIIKNRKTYIVTNKINHKKIGIFKKKGYKFIYVNSLENKEDFNLLFKKILKLGYPRILIESGLILINTLVRNKLINDLYLFKSNIKLKNSGKNNISPNFLKKFKFRPIQINLNNDKLFIKKF
tara:strand:+ start:53 stop:1117 length:1065 start_codon:yes stop_codon:yes gene_type:complete